MEVKVVLCPVDFSDLSRREIELAVGVCEAFGARLVLHHNLSAISPGFSKAWEWDQEHRHSEESEAEAHGRMQKLLNDLPAAVHAEAAVSHGPVAIVALALAHELPADLLVLGSHGWSTDDHASVTERILDRSPCPVLTVQGKGEGAALPGLRAGSGGKPARILAATDLSETGNHAIAYAMDLARRFSLEVHVLHATSSALEGAARQALGDLVPTDLFDQVERHVRIGRPEEEIQKSIGEIDPAFVVMGTRARGFFRWLRPHSTALATLHRSSRPVWFVPPLAGA
jgi:universal stress protein A